MGLFDSIRRTLGGGDDTANEHSESGESATEPASDGPTVTDSAALSPAEFRQRAETVADRSADLDFSTASLSRLDAAVADQFDDEPVAASEDTAYTTHTVRFGSYLGEVLVRELDGRWVQDDGWGVTVAGADDERTVAVFDVAARSFADEPVFAAVLDRLETELSVPADSDGPAGAGDPADEPEPSGPATSESPQGDDTDSTVTSWEDAGGWQPATETPGFDGSDADADEGSDADADEGGVADTPDDADPVDDDAFHIPDAEGASLRRPAPRHRPTRTQIPTTGTRPARTPGRWLRRRTPRPGATPQSRYSTGWIGRAIRRRTRLPATASAPTTPSERPSSPSSGANATWISPPSR
ncbi:hypothetical protein ACFQL1_10260 [Halomicroarcula sp. GCM10025709]|uniref:hypothetical protein n=1 Tax=Halomicroarcula sp. GCM10025709 TaxID=3252669 RepID=UPI003612173C